MKQWEAIKYESLPWVNRINIDLISKAARKKILSNYESSIPNKISNNSIVLPKDLEARIFDLMINLSKFDANQSRKEYSFPSMLLRSESAASSQIENLTSSIRNIALAELTDKSPENAKIIARNVSAMRTALGINEHLSKEVILRVHKKLMSNSLEESYAGRFRDQVVWVGGSNYSPHNAIFVPPQFTLVDNYMDDLIDYAGRDDVNPIVKSAVIHAQFETIHPFIDGNGRTGRTLIHKSLLDDGILESVSLPLSTGLLVNTEKYMAALLAYQAGDPIPVIEQVTSALEMSLVIGDEVFSRSSKIIEKWEDSISERKTSSIWKLLYLLFEQPVINSTYLSDKLSISLRGANMLINRALEYGVLRKVGNDKRGIFYQSDQIIEIMNDVSDLSILKRSKVL